MQKPTACPLCKSNSILTDTEHGEVICSKCGMVISDKIQETVQESHTFMSTTQGSKDRERTGMPTSLARSDMGLSSIIARTDKDASGYKIEPSMLSTMHRLRTWDFRTQSNTPGEKTFRIAFGELKMLKDKLGLPDPVVEKTAYIYRKAQQKGLLHGRSINAVLAAAIYIACRQMEVPRTLNDITKISGLKRKSIAKCQREMMSKLDLKLPTFDATKYIARVANKANVSGRTKLEAINLMNNVVKSGVSAGKDPMGLAASVLYASCIKTGEHKTQINIANAAQTTEVTIRNRFKDLKNRLELLNN